MTDDPNKVLQQPGNELESPIVLTDPQRNFRIEEYKALRSEMDARNTEVAKLQTGGLAAAAAVSAWLIPSALPGNVLWFLPALILGGVSFALICIGRHMNRVSSYITHNIERHFDIPLADATGAIQMPRSHVWLDYLSGKPRPPANIRLSGGWETWFEEQRFNYTWYQILAFAAAFLLALGVGICGYIGTKFETPQETPIAEGIAVDGRLLSQTNTNEVEPLVPALPAAADLNVKSKAEWNAVLYEKNLILTQGDITRVIPISRVIDVSLRKSAESAPVNVRGNKPLE